MTTLLITGATRGLGRATARQLTAAGHTVWIGARSLDQGRALAAELRARAVQLDVTDDASVAAAFEHVAANGGLDVLVNNAGIALEGLNGPDALSVFDVNAVGIVRTTQAALPLLQHSAHPAVVNVSSALGSFWAVREPTRPASQVRAIVYGASKSAVSMLTLQYALAVPHVRFTAVEPGYTATELGGVDHPHARPVEVSAAVVAHWATVLDAPSGTFEEDAGTLPW